MPRWLETALVSAAALSLLSLVRIAIVNIAALLEKKPHPASAPPTRRDG